MEIPYMEPFAISEEVKNSIIPDNIFHQFCGLIAKAMRERFKDADSVPAMVGISFKVDHGHPTMNTDDIFKNAYRSFYEQNGIELPSDKIEELFDALPDTDALCPLMTLCPKPEQWDENRFKWIQSLGRNIVDIEGIIPNVFFVCSEIWYLAATVDKDNPIDMSIRPSQHNERQEGVMVCGQTQDQRSHSLVMPIDRIDGKMIIGPHSNNMFGTSKAGMRNYLGQAFWRGYFDRVVKKT